MIAAGRYTKQFCLRSAQNLSAFTLAHYALTSSKGQNGDEPYSLVSQRPGSALPNRAGPKRFGLLSVSPISGCPKAISGAPRIATLVQERPADQSCGAPSTPRCAHLWCQQPGAKQNMPRCDPRDALGDLLVDAVVPVLGWPAFYKCSALSRAWRATLKRVGSDLRRRHAPPPPPFGLPLLDRHAQARHRRFAETLRPRGR